MCYWREGVGPWMAIGGVLMVLFWAGVVGLAVWAFSRLTGHSHKGNGALAAVRERYARGEISKEEFDRIKKDLS
jgi:putative membrane protein